MPRGELADDFLDPAPARAYAVSRTGKAIGMLLQHRLDRFAAHARTRELDLADGKLALLRIQHFNDARGLFAAPSRQLKKPLLKPLVQFVYREKQVFNVWPDVVFSFMPGLGRLLQRDLS